MYEYYFELYNGVKFVIGSSYYLGKIPVIKKVTVKGKKLPMERPAPLKEEKKKEEKVIVSIHAPKGEII